MPIIPEKFSAVSVVVFGSIICLWPAFYNGYPLVFTDTELYLRCGNEWKSLEDRSFVYGFLTALLSLGNSLWPVVFFQSVIFNLIFFRFFSFVMPNLKPVFFLLFIVMLCSCTALPLDICNIMPDAFSALSLMLLFLLLADTTCQKSTFFFYLISYLMLAQTHLSYLSAHLLLSVALLMLRYVGLKPLQQLHIIRFWLLLGVTILNLFLYLGEKRALGGTGSISSYSHVFLTAKLVENGMLKRFLNNECITHNYELCRYKDSLAAEPNSGAFVWLESSAFNKTGGWANPHTEYKSILIEILSTPAYAFEYTWETIKATTKQLFLHKIGNSVHAYPREGWGPWPAIEKYYPHELGDYDVARQHTSQFYVPFAFMSYVYLMLFVAATLYIIIAFTRNRISVLMVFIVLALVFNALITGGLVSLEDRYSTRQNWLLSVAVLAEVLKYKFGASKRDN